MIRKTQYHSRATSIYPGIYQPAFTKVQDIKNIKGSKPPVNVIEYPDYYQIEMPAPGFSKGDFFIETRGSSLLITGNKERSAETSNVQYRQHGYRYNYIRRRIELPIDADTEFSTAEFKNGVLNIFLYKNTYPVQSHQNFIIVY